MLICYNNIINDWRLTRVMNTYSRNYFLAAVALLPRNSDGIPYACITLVPMPLLPPHTFKGSESESMHNCEEQWLRPSPGRRSSGRKSSLQNPSYSAVHVHCWASGEW